MCKVHGGRMCDVDGCSTMDELTHYTDDVDLCKWHKYLAKHMGISPTPLALDGGDSAASEQFPAPEVLSTLRGESTPAHRK